MHIYQYTYQEDADDKGFICVFNPSNCACLEKRMKSSIYWSELTKLDRPPNDLPIKDEQKRSKQLYFYLKKGDKTVLHYANDLLHLPSCEHYQ